MNSPEWPFFTGSKSHTLINNNSQFEAMWEFKNRSDELQLCVNPFNRFKQQKKHHGLLLAEAGLANTVPQNPQRYCHRLTL